MKRTAVYVVLVWGLLFGASAFADNHTETDVDPKLNAALVAYEHRDFKKALRLLTPVATRGEAEAQFIVGRIHDLGLGTKKDLKKAEDWYRKAAKQGHPRAQHNLAIKLTSKEGNHDQEAVTLLRKAAKGGYAPAQFLLGRNYSWGDISLYWHRKAAYQGYAPAQMQLSDVYLVGARAKKDLVLALMWTILAKKSGHPGGGKSRSNILRKKMTLKQIREAKRLADLW